MNMSTILDTLAGTNGAVQPSSTTAPSSIEVIPYDARLDVQADAFLPWIWHKMQQDDLVDYYFPGQRDTGFATFVRLMSGDAQVALFKTALDSDQWEDRIAGFISWTPSHLGATEAIIAGFIFFRRWQDHHTTDEAAVAAFNYWFTKTKASVVLGICPSLHHAAMRYNKRVGLKQIGLIPGAHLFKGQVCDAILFAKTREEWQKEQSCQQQS